jgi:hypothetical protein
VRIYTATTHDNQPVVSVNAGSVREARRVLAAILGTDDGMVVRLASASEAAEWRATASSVERRKMRRMAKKSRDTANAPKQLADAAD